MPRSGVRLTDKQWSRIGPLLPRLPRGSKGGRPWADERAVLDGILWVLKTGARWRDLPAEYPSPSTCWRRLKLWDEQGTWLRIWRAFLSELDMKGRLRWEETFMDGTFYPAKKGAPKSEKPSGGRARSAWWWSTARVFLWECPLPRPHQRKSRSRRGR
jgi:transposase